MRQRPFADLVAPGVTVLWTAQAFRLGSREQLHLRAIGEPNAVERGFELRHPVRRADCQQAGLALHHHCARFGQRCGDQRDPGARVRFGNLAHPFGTGAGLAEPAPRHDHPDAPIALRCALLAAREQLPVELEFGFLLVVEGIGDEWSGLLLVLVHPLEIGAQRAPSARARSCLSRRRISSTLRSIESRTSAALTLRCCAMACEAVSRCAASRRIALAKS